MLRGLRRFLFAVVAAQVTLVLMLVAAAVTAVVSYVYLPLPAASLPPERPPPGSASTVYAIDGTPIGEFRGAEQQVPVAAADIPDTIRRAVVAAEDHRFFAHRGVDWQGLLRAVKADVRSGEFSQGGSTLTQQLVKNVYTGSRRSLGRKLHEALVAVQLERRWSKDQILTRYLNSVYLGDSTFGVEAASRSYFHKPARDLSLSEAALLAGVIPAPSRYSPRTHPEAAEQRRQEVLDRLLRYGLAHPEEVERARAETPVVQPPPRPASPFPYFMDYLRVYLLDVEHYPPDLVYHGGLRIETTFDPRLQGAAEAAVRAHLPDPKDPQAALVAVEPQTGFVRAVVGGRAWEASQVTVLSVLVDATLALVAASWATLAASEAITVPLVVIPVTATL